MTTNVAKSGYVCALWHLKLANTQSKTLIDGKVT